MYSYRGFQTVFAEQVLMASLNPHEERVISQYCSMVLELVYILFKKAMVAPESHSYLCWRLFFYYLCDRGG